MSRGATLNLSLALLCLVALIGACLLGSTPLPLESVLRALAGMGPETNQIVVWSIRLPRALAALLVGFTLGVCGAALQGLLRNPLAEPGVLGISATSTLMATVVIYFNVVRLSPWMLPLGAIAGALLSTALLAAAAARTRSVVTLILIGFGLSSFAGAFMSLLLNLAEEAAETSGLNVSRLRLRTVLGSGLAIGAAISLAGAIGFVGLVAPHVVRPLVQHDPARSLLPSGLLAGLLLVLADIGVRLVPTSFELNLGVIAAVLGAPVFIWLVMRREAHRD